MIAFKVKKYLLLNIGLVLASFTINSSLCAQTEYWELEGITVTATRTERSLKEVPMSVGVVTAEDLRREPQNNVADMLSSLPGVMVQDGYMPGGKRVIIRGESPMRSLILIDGVKVSEQKSMSGSAFLINTGEIERVEVIKGPASVLYGSEAIGGVINIITKKGGDKPVGFSQNFVIDSSNTSLESQSALFGSYQGVSYRFSGSGLNADNRRTPSGTVENSSFENRYFSGYLGYDWDAGAVFLRASRYTSRIEVPANTEWGMITQGANAGFFNTTTVSPYLPQWDRESVSGGLELSNLTDYFAKLKFNAYGQNTTKDFFNNVHVYNVRTVNSTVTEVVVDQNSRAVNEQKSFGGNMQSEWLLGRHFVILGADYNKDTLNANDYRLNGYTRRYVNGSLQADIPAAEALYRYKANQSAVCLFLQDEWSFSDDFTATLGLRQTWIKSSLRANNNPQLPAHNNISDAKLVGSAGLVYSGFNNWALRALWSQGYRFPALSQLYLDAVHGQTGRILPNPYLKPETSNNYEIGARFSNNNWNLNAAFFFTNAKNFITPQKLGGGSNDYQYVNMDKAVTYGLEIELDYTFAEYGLTPYTSATFMRRRHTGAISDLNNNPLTYKTYDTAVPAFQGRVGLKWQKDFDVAQNVFVDFYINWATSAKNCFYDGTYTHALITQREKGWQTLNLTVGTEWGAEQTWHASLSLRNITNKAYTQAGNNVEDPRFHVVLQMGFAY